MHNILSTPISHPTIPIVQRLTPSPSSLNLGVLLSTVFKYPNLPKSRPLPTPTPRTLLLDWTINLVTRPAYPLESLEVGVGNSAASCTSTR